MTFASLLPLASAAIGTKQIGAPAPAVGLFGGQGVGGQDQ